MGVRAQVARLFQVGDKKARTTPTTEVDSHSLDIGGNVLAAFTIRSRFEQRVVFKRRRRAECEKLPPYVVCTAVS
jgi:hypothetical protein